MPPTFSKIAVVATPVISGLRCGHTHCYALFSTFEDSEEHALNAHSGKILAISCNIYEKKLESGQVQLYRALDEDATSDDGSQVTRDANGQPGTELLKLSTPDKPSSVRRETAPTEAPMDETPLASQSTSRSQCLSRQPTEPAIDIPSSSSSSLSSSSSSSSSSTLSLSLSSRSFSSVSSSTTDIGDQKLNRVLAAVRGVVDECRICWVTREQRRPHRTFKCATGICSDEKWHRFKVSLRFPKNVVCFFCLSPYGPPFNHARTTRPDDCEYPDVLKELVYILYQDEASREKIFTKLGVAQPSGLSLYQRFIGKKQQDGIFRAYDVVNAYLELRELGEL